MSVKCAQNWRGSACGSPISPDAIFRNIHNRLLFQAYIDENEQKCACRMEFFSMADAFFNGTHRLPTTLCFPDIDPCPAVQQLLSLPPVRHQLRHKLMKRRGMIRLDKMAELMYCNIFHTRRRRLPELPGKSHDLLFRLTAPPTGHHAAHFNLGPCYPHPGKNRIKPLTDFFHLLQAALCQIPFEHPSASVCIGWIFLCY